MNEFWAAIIGAVVGGIISFAIQLIVIRSQRLERLANIERSRHVAAYHLTTSLHFVLMTQVELARMLTEARNRADEFHKDKALWRTLLPIPNLPSEVRFPKNRMLFSWILTKESFYRT
jgi:hypothetical protein